MPSLPATARRLPRAACTDAAYASRYPCRAHDECMALWNGGKAQSICGNPAFRNSESAANRRAAAGVAMSRLDFARRLPSRGSRSRGDGRVMSLSVGQRRALSQIEKALADDDLRLGLLFSAFTRLSVHEAIPVTAPIPGRPRRRTRSAVVTVIGLAVVTSAFILSQALPIQQECPGTVTAVSAHMRSAGAGRQPACMPRQIGPGGIHAR